MTCMKWAVLGGNCCLWLLVHYVLATMELLGFCNIYALHTYLSIVTVTMVKGSKSGKVHGCSQDSGRGVRSQVHVWHAGSSKAMVQ